MALDHKPKMSHFSGFYSSCHGELGQLSDFGPTDHWQEINEKATSGDGFHLPSFLNPVEFDFQDDVTKMNLKTIQENENDIIESNLSSETGEKIKKSYSSS